MPLSVSQDKRLSMKIHKAHIVIVKERSLAMKLELLTNATVIDYAIRFVSFNKSKERLKSSANDSEHDKESSEPDYDEDQGQLEEEQEEETKTINQVF
jgi:hypothetical protein